MFTRFNLYIKFLTVPNKQTLIQEKKSYSFERTHKRIIKVSEEP